MCRSVPFPIVHRIPILTILLTLLLTTVLTSAPRAEIHEVTVASFAFTPQNITITDGDTVRWVWLSGFHTATSGSDCVADDLFNGPLDAGNPTLEFTFDGQLGDIPYFCIPHCVIDMVGNITVLPQMSSVEEGTAMSPEMPRPLFSAAPNPLQSSTTLTFTLGEPAAVHLAIYDAGGRVVTTLVDGDYGSGAHAVPWSGVADAGGALATGVYYAHFSAGDQVDVRPLMLVR